MTFTVQESPWVTVRPNDPSFQLQGPLSVANRAGIEISQSCPDSIRHQLQVAMFNGWLTAVAHVPRTDPTLLWDTLKHE